MQQVLHQINVLPLYTTHSITTTKSYTSYHNEQRV